MNYDDMDETEDEEDDLPEKKGRVERAKEAYRKYAPRVKKAAKDIARKTVKGAKTVAKKTTEKTREYAPKAYRRGKQAYGEVQRYNLRRMQRVSRLERTGQYFPSEIRGRHQSTLAALVFKPKQHGLSKDVLGFGKTRKRVVRV